MKKCILTISVLLAVCMLLPGCAKKQPQPSASPTASAAAAGETAKPTATPNNNISHTEGRELEGKEPGVEGPVLSLTENEIDVKVGDKTFHFTLGEKAKNDLGYFNKNPEQPRIMEGTIVNVYYEKDGKNMTAKTIEIVESN